MKVTKTASERSKRIPPVTMYREELQLIFDTMLDRYGLIDISTPEHTYSDCDVLPEFAGSDATVVSIRATVRPDTSRESEGMPTFSEFLGYGSARISFDRHGASVHVVGNTLEDRGVFERLVEILDGASSRTASAVRHPVMAGMAVLMTFALGLTLEDRFGSMAWEAYVITAIVAIAAAAAWYALYSRTASRVVTAKRSQRPNFWERKGDDLKADVIKVVLSAVFGAAMTLMVQHLTTKAPSAAQSNRPPESADTSTGHQPQPVAKPPQ